MTYKVGDHVLAHSCKGVVIKIHQCGEFFVYEVRSDYNEKKVITVCEQEIKLLVS